MALKSWTTDGYTNTSGWSWRQIVEDTSYDIISNTSIVTVSAQIKGSYFGGTPTITIICDGKTETDSPTYPYPTYVNNWTTVFSKTFTVNHESDGSKSVTVSSSWSASGFVPTVCNASDNYSLTTIPRATPTPALTLNVKDTTVFYIQPYANFSHAVKISVGNYSAYLTTTNERSSTKKIFDPSVKSFTFDCDGSFYKLFNSTQINGTMSIETYSGSTLIGTTSNTLVIKANEQLCKPTAVGSIVDTNEKTIALTKDEDSLVRYKSTGKLTLRLIISDTDDDNTTLTHLTVAGNNITDLAQREFVIQNPQNPYTTIVMRNSRTFSNTAYVYADGTFINYILPTITIVSLKRTEPTTGDLSVSYKGDYFNGKFSTDEPNSLTVAWYYKEKDASDWILGGNVTPTIKEGENTFSGDISIESIFDYQKQYNFKISVDDRLSSNSVLAAIPRGYPIFWWGDNFVDILGELRLQGQKLIVPEVKNTKTTSDINTYSTTYINNLHNMSYCKMVTNFDEKSITDATQITGWTNYQENGDLGAFPSRNRLEITNTTLALIMGKTCGQNGMSIYFKIEDSDGNALLADNQQGNLLIQPSGNNFWSSSLPTMFVKLDPAKTYYVTLWANSYIDGSVGQSYMNNGFGKNGTWISALKIM
nr:MAG TPA: protein of unknown function DUF859 [Caudoviricetes sp.]